MTQMDEIIERLDRIERRLNDEADQMCYAEVEQYLFKTRGARRGSLYQKVHRGQIPSHKKRGEARYFLRSELDAWLRENRILTDEEIRRRR